MRGNRNGLCVVRLSYYSVNRRMTESHSSPPPLLLGCYLGVCEGFSQKSEEAHGSGSAGAEWALRLAHAFCKEEYANVLDRLLVLTQRWLV